MSIECCNPFINEVLDLTICLTQQTLDRDRGFKSAILQRFEYAANNPP